MPQVSQATCDRCNGTGEYRGTRRDGSSYVGRCFACQGYRPNGPRYRRYSRPAVVAAVALPSIVAVPAGQPASQLGPSRGLAALQAFQAVHPAEYQWLSDQNTAGVSFAASLLAGLQRYGNLTPRQLAAVQRNLAHVEPAPVGPVVEVCTMGPDMGTAYDAAGRVVPDSVGHASGEPMHAATAFAALVAPVTIDMAQIFSAFDTAAASGLRKVRLTLGTIELKRTGERFRGGAGNVMVYVDGTYRGYVSRDNVFHLGSARTFDATMAQRVREAVANPRAAAATHGHDTGYCSCCRRLLTDPPSVMAGIGPVCIRRFGWSF